MRVAKFQRIERPLNQPDSPAQRFVALKKLQHPAHAPVAVIAQHSRHVRMQVRHAIAHTDHRERVADQPGAIKRSQYLPPGLRRHHERRDWLNLQVCLAPNLALELHTTLKLLELLALADLDWAAHFRVCSFASSRNGDCPSAFFVAPQSASISSLGRSLNSRPDLRARASIARNRLENFALAFFNAISGSTCKNRARFTAANSRSPISSSNFCWSLSLKAISNSAVSSRILSMTPFAFSQSNPIRDALRVSWKPSSVAGNARETPSSKEGSSFAPSPPSPLAARRSSALICSQFLSTSFESFACVSPKTCGCRRIILS